MTQDVGFEGMLIGAGALNQDQYTDLLFYVPVSNRLIKAIGSSEGFSYHYLAMIPGMEAIPEGTSLFFGDFDADGTDELILVDKLTVMTYEFGETDVTPVATTTLPFATNVDHIHIDAILPLFGAGGDVTGDGVDDLLIVGKNQKTGRDALYSLVYPTEAPAYDYSSHIIKTEDEYILYTGGLCIDYNTDVYKETAADHIMAYTSKDGLVWHRNLDAACFFLGNELGVAGNYEPGDVFTEKWWMGNTMEPEVLYVDGTYYMYYQCENYRLDKDGVLMSADRIGVATSKDGIHFDRKTDKPVIITSDEYACFTHEEVIYVPDDPDGKCFWMYVRYVHNNREVKRIRICSADPTCFNMDEDYTECVGLGHIGNCTGYINDYDGRGNRFFVRINMATLAFKGDESRKRWVPTLQLSADGIHWIDSGIEIASADLDNPDEAKRNNICFMGFSTINRTGEIARTADGAGYEFFFVGCTTSSAVAPEIFYSSEGLGRVTFTVTP